jgi:hypothetical protein
MSVLEPWETDEAVERHRDSSGQAPNAGTGELSGEGDSHRRDGGSPLMLAMVGLCSEKSKECMCWLLEQSRFLGQESGDQSFVWMSRDSKSPSTTVNGTTDQLQIPWTRTIDKNEDANVFLSRAAAGREAYGVAKKQQQAE